MIVVRAWVIVHIATHILKCQQAIVQMAFGAMIFRRLNLIHSCIAITIAMSNFLMFFTTIVSIIFWGWNMLITNRLTTARITFLLIDQAFITLILINNIMAMTSSGSGMSLQETSSISISYIMIFCMSFKVWTDLTFLIHSASTISFLSSPS